MTPNEMDFITEEKKMTPNEMDFTDTKITKKMTPIDVNDLKSKRTSNTETNPDLSDKTGSTEGLDYAMMWEADDFSDKDWYPQGVCGMADGDQKFLLISWYQKSTDNTTRISFVKVGGSDHPYIHVLLLKEDGTPFKSHAGGLFVYEKYLFVADTDYGLNYFDTSTIESLSSENNFASNGCLYAMKMVNKINIKTLLAKESLSDISFSWCDMPRNEENRVLVGSYVTSGADYITRSRYVAKFSIDPALNFTLIDCWQNGTGSDSAGDGLPNNTQGMTFSSATGTDIFLASCSGSTAHLKALKLFDKNWTSVVPYVVDETAYIMMLKEQDGIVHIYKPSADGCLGENLHSYDWSKGWTSVTSYIVDGTTYIMLLKEQNGTVHIHKPLVDGRLGSNLHSYDWSGGWTSVTPFIVDGTTYIMLLKDIDGTVHIHKPLADGRLGDNLHSYEWREGWTSVTPFVVDGTTYIMLLKIQDGTVHIHKPLADGSLGDNLHSYDWSEGWSSVIRYIVDGVTYIMLLKEDGTVHIHKPLADGSLGDSLHTYGCSVVKTWLWPYGTEDVHISSSGNIWGCTEHPSSRYVFRGKVSTYTDEI